MAAAVRRVPPERLVHLGRLLLLAVFGGWLWLSLTHISPYAASWDEVDFVLALDRFDLLAMQPHFPGYPYFVLGGMLMKTAGADPAAAYGLLNALLAASAAVPIRQLARRRLPALQAELAALVILTAPFLWAQSLRPMSEAAAIAVLWWLLWSWVAAMEKRTWPRAAAVLFLFGVLMGIRLSFLPFGLLPLWLAAALAAEWRQSGRRAVPRLLIFAGAGALFQALWVGGLAMSEGSAAAFVKLAAGFASGHFSEWGGGISAAPMPPGERLLRFAGGNLLWTGWFARSAALMGAAAALVLAAVLRAGAAKPRRAAAGSAAGDAAGQAADELRRGVAAVAPAPAAPAKPVERRPLLSAAFDRLCRPPLAAALAVPAVGYAIWAFAAQNIDKPRHVTPLTGILWLLVLLYALLPVQQDAKPAERRLAAAAGMLAAAALFIQLAEGAELVRKQADERPAVYRLADYAREASAAGERIKLYTWEETRVLQYLDVPPVHERILTYAYFRAGLLANPNARVLLTGKVLEGFEAQAGPLRGHVRRIAVFRSDPMLDPVYGTIELYEWIDRQGGADPRQG